ncbi:hypothetical protein IWX90DRAFT_421151, partial [Phyllosticta citrichinensis]
MVWVACCLGYTETDWVLRTLPSILPCLSLSFSSSSSSTRSAWLSSARLAAYCLMGGYLIVVVVVWSSLGLYAGAELRTDGRTDSAHLVFEASVCLSAAAAFVFGSRVFLSVCLSAAVPCICSGTTRHDMAIILRLSGRKGKGNEQMTEAGKQTPMPGPTSSFLMYILICVSLGLWVRGLFIGINITTYLLF